MLNYACVQGYMAGNPKPIKDHKGYVFCNGYINVVTKGVKNLVNFQAFGTSAQYILKYCHSGDLVTFSGDIRGFQKWVDQKTGVTRYRMPAFTVSKIELIESKRQETDELPPELADDSNDDGEKMQRPWTSD